MKFIVSVLTLFAITFLGAAPAQAAICTPYTVPVQSTIVNCGPGFVGVKYKTSTLNCATGKVTVSAEYDTSGCATASMSGGQLASAMKCALTPDACAAVPVVQGCPIGQHWTLAGTRTAHCVPDDPVCGWGTSLIHDATGIPSCQTNTCSGGKVLQADGISCACPTNTVLSNGICVPTPPTCIASVVTNSAACTGGQTGTMTQTKTTSCPGGQYGTPSVTYSAWNTSSCVTPAVTCTSSTTSESGSCPTGYTGSKYRSVYTSCPAGSYGAPSVSYSGWTDNCVAPAPVCTTSTNSVTAACGTGFTGTRVITTTTLCPSGSTTSEDTSGCGCANGALDYPTCKVQPPPMPPVNQCPADHYLDKFWKVASDGYFYRRFLVRFEPVTCNRSETGIGEGDGTCLSPGCPI